MNTVAIKFIIFGACVRYKASLRACTLFVLVTIKCTSAINAPSNSTPLAAVIVVGLIALHTIFSQILVAINNEIPDPSPYPFYKNSSSRITTNPANDSCTTISNDPMVPKVSKSPYIPLITYAIASPIVIKIPNNF